jgi:putative transposase
VVVAGANRNDFKLTAETLQGIEVERPAPTLKRPQGLCLDKDYDRQEVHDLLEAFGFTPHIRRRGEEAHAITGKRKFKPRRWVVERTHSWMNRFRVSGNPDPLDKKGYQLRRHASPRHGPDYLAR